jgi:chitinase
VSPTVNLPDPGVKNNEAPTVTVSNPANAITGDFVTINATALDTDGSISSVEFFVNNVSIGSDATSPYSIQYKTIKGKHKIKAIATDNLGLKGTSKEDSILVENNQFPIVTINSPKNAVSGDEVTFTASAEDKDGTIVQVEFFVDNASIGIVANAPYSIKWVTTSGNHKVKAIATDNRGFTGSSADSTLNVIDNIAPTLELIVDSTAKVDAQVTITATANDVDGTITKVEFYVDNTLISTISNTPYTTTWKAITGSHTIKVIATDNRGLTSTKTKNMMVKDNNAALENIVNIQTLVYPNPANKELSIIASENAQISLTDVSGKTIIAPTEIYANTTHTMHIQNVSAGVYLVKIETPTASKTERVIIQ